jgi:hypothetical protein
MRRRFKERRMIPPLTPQVRAFDDGRAEVRLQSVLPLHVALEIAALAALHGGRGPYFDPANDDDQPSTGRSRGVR